MRSTCKRTHHTLGKALRRPYSVPRQLLRAQLSAIHSVHHLRCTYVASLGPVYNPEGNEPLPSSQTLRSSSSHSHPYCCHKTLRDIQSQPETAGWSSHTPDCDTSSARQCGAPQPSSPTKSAGICPAILQEPAGAETVPSRLPCMSCPCMAHCSRKTPSYISVIQEHR